MNLVLQTLYPGAASPPTRLPAPPPPSCSVARAQALPPPAHPDADEAELARAIEHADRLTGRAMTLALALEDIGAIDLPPLPETAIDQAQLRAVASLYLAAELEQADVIPAVEALAGLASSGAVSADLGAAGGLVRAVWKSRNERATAEERAGFFARLFGSSDEEASNSFELDMIELCEALYKLDELATNATYGGIAQQARVRAAAGRLIDGIVAGASGITVFFAQEILTTLKQALAILGHPDLRGALGARDVWAAVERIDRLARRPQADGRTHLRRGRAGMTILAWLAEAAPHLRAPAQPLVGLDHPVIAAAIDWLEASLSLSESAAAPPPQAPALPPASPWAALAG